MQTSINENKSDYSDASMKINKLHSDALVWDNHTCLPLDLDQTKRFLPQLGRYKKTGTDIVLINVGYGEISLERHLEMAHFVREWLEDRPDQFQLIKTVDDIFEARKTGKLAVGFDIEGCAAIDHDINLISVFHNLGVRWMSLAYNQGNALGSGCHDTVDKGLTERGRQYLNEMARVGVVACCSHTGYATAFDAIEYSTNPIIFSHSNARAVHDHPRNLPDDLIKANANKGGVIGINGIGIFLGKNDTRIETVVRHIDHIVQLVGSEHVGIGLDYVFDKSELDVDLSKYSNTFPEGYGYEAGIRIVELEEVPRITDRLLSLGYQDNDIENILGLNFLRVAKAVWK